MGLRVSGGVDATTARNNAKENVMANENQKSEAMSAGSPVMRMAEEFIGKEEVAKRLGKTLRTVDNWMKRRMLPYYKIGRSVSFRWSECEAHLSATCRVAGRNVK